MIDGFLALKLVWEEGGGVRPSRGWTVYIRNYNGRWVPYRSTRGRPRRFATLDKALSYVSPAVGQEILLESPYFVGEVVMSSRF